jgi:hypothetical protein
MAHCIVSDAELFARWGMLFRAFGVDESGYRSTIQHFAYNPHNLPWWLYGTPSSYRGRRERYLPEDIRARTESSVAEYDSRSFESFAEELRKGSGLPAMVITTPGYQLDERAVRSMFALRLLREIPEEGAAIWKLQLGP